MNISVIYNNHENLFDEEDLLSSIMNKINLSSNSLQLKALNSKIDFIFGNSFSKGISAEIIYDYIINYLQCDYKQYSHSITSYYSLLEFITRIVNYLNENTYFTIDRSVFLLEYYIENLLQFFPNKTVVSIKELTYTNNSSFRCCSIVNCYIIAKGIYEQMIKGCFVEEEWLSTAIIDYDQSDIGDGFFVNPKGTIELITEWIYVCLFNADCSERVMMKLFKGLKERFDIKDKDKEKRKLTDELMDSSFKYMIDLVYHYRSIWDPNSLALFHWALESPLNKLVSSAELSKRIEECIYNCSIRDGNVKTEKIVIILKAYLQVNLPKIKDKNKESTIMYCIFNCFFTSTYSQLMGMTNSFYRNFFNMNNKTKKIVNDYCMKFLEYSLFIIDYMKIHHNHLQLINDTLKYNCLYNYIHYAGFISSINPFTALLSCYFLKEIITLFSFNSSSTQDSFLPKVLFNYLSLIYQINQSYHFNNHLKPFIDYILTQIPDTSLTANSDWYFLSIGISSIIPYFDISLWYNNPISLIENIIEITTRIQYFRLYEVDLLLHHLSVILDNDIYHDIIIRDYKTMEEINDMLSYVLFNYDCIRVDEVDTNFFNCERFNYNIFCIINKLNMMDIDEYYYLPYKKYDAFFNFNSFINFIQEKIGVYIKQSSFLPLELLSSVMFIDANSKDSNKDIHKEIESFLMFYLHQRKDKLSSNYSTSTQMTINLLNLLSIIPNLTKVEINIIEELINTNLYHIDIALYLITSLLSLGLYNTNIIQFMTDLPSSETKVEFTYFLTIIKFFNNFLMTEFDRHDTYLKEKCGHDININALLNNYDDLHSIPQKILKILPKEFLTSLSIYKQRKSKWDNVLSELNSTEVISEYIALLNVRNYPKSCMNLSEWKIFSDMRDSNCTNILQYKSPKVIYCYYNSICCLDDNEDLLQQYFMDQSLLYFLEDYCNKNNLMLPLAKGTDANYHLLDNIESYFISLNRTYLNNACQMYNSDIKGIKALSMFTCITKIRIITILLTTSLYSEYEFYRKKLELQIASFIKKSFNKMKEEVYGKMSNVAILYDIDRIMRAIDQAIIKRNENNDYVKLNLPDKNIGETLRHMIIKRPLSFLSKHLPQLKIRRALCALTNEIELELKCLIDIMKIYYINHYKENLGNYYNVYKVLLLDILKVKPQCITIEMLYICLKYHLELYPLYTYEFEELYKIFTAHMSSSLTIPIILNPRLKVKFEILQLKSKAAISYHLDEITTILHDRIIYLTNHPYKDNTTTNNNKEYYLEEYCIKAHLYLEYLVISNQSSFDKFNHDNKITLDLLFTTLFEYLSIALKICLMTTNKKLLTVYLPQLINYAYKIQKTFTETNMTEKAMQASFSKSKKPIINAKGNIICYNRNLNKTGEYKEELETLLIEMKMLPKENIQIILPQLLICFSLPNTPLYSLAIDLLVTFTNDKIDIAGYWLGAFLSTNDMDVDAMCFNKASIEKKRPLFHRLYSQSRTFADSIKKKLNEGNQRILSYYETFQGMIKDLYLLVKKKNEKCNDVLILIQQINSMIKTSKCFLILPIISNLNEYNPKIREDICMIVNGHKKNKGGNNKVITIDNLKQYNTLFITEISEKIILIQSKELPLKITFYAKTAYDILKDNKKSPLTKGKEYSFVLKGDVVDITKEMKSSELFNEINSFFKLKSYDINHQMSLKQYLISPITSHLVLVEWLIGTQTFSYINEEMKKKFQVEPIKQRSTKSKSFNLNDFKKLNESSNVLFLYYHLKYPNPNDWWKAKKAYVISSSVWSMTCFFVGVGDRHPGNIMIGSNGEVIHIDFGYVLGKGTILPVPEIVPFRFTKNIRRNLGVLEENGLFIFIAKKTIDLFKKYYLPLIRRIEYYLFDPYVEDEVKENCYMIRKIRELQAFFMKDYNYENSHVKVFQLILQCKSDECLAKMYHGWGPDI